MCFPGSPRLPCCGTSDRRPRQPRPGKARCGDSRGPIRSARPPGDPVAHARPIHAADWQGCHQGARPDTQIELRARISKRLLGQERLPLAGPNKYLGQHFPIPVGMKVEGKPEEGE
jgi:hypothetical protein